MYKSFFGSGNNIALWNVDDKLEFIGSKVYINYCSNHAFVSMGDGEAIKNTTMFNKQVRKGADKAIKETEEMYESLIKKSLKDGGMT